MADREKVIKGLTCCMNPLKARCPECPYYPCYDEDTTSEKLLADALALLKEQEPVMPVLVPKGRGAGVGYNCECGTELVVLRGTVDIQSLHEQVRFCRMCGKAVKWDA